MTKFRYLVFTTMFVLASVFAAFADQIELKNGDRLSGKVIKQDAEIIVLQTEFAGTITISKNSIAKLISDEDVIKEIVPKQKTLEEKAADRKGGKDDTADMEPEIAAAESPAEPEVENAAAMPEKASKKRGLSITTGWDGNANIGFSLTSGNSSNTLFTAGVRAEKAGENDKWTTYGNTLWNRNKVGALNLTTSNAMWGGLRYDRNITKKVFAFGAFDFERDKPQRLNMRNVFGGGLGYHAIKNDSTALDLFSGLAYNRTWYIGPNKNAAEFLVGDSFKHSFNDKMRFVQGFTLYPNLSDGGKFRFVFDSTLSADITKRIGWFVSIGDRYNSAPPFITIKKSDFLFATGLKMGFGGKK